MVVVSFGEKKKKQLKKKDLENLIHNLQWGIQQWNVLCHAATDTLAMLTHKLTFQFGGKIGILLLVHYSAIFKLI